MSTCVSFSAKGVTASVFLTVCISPTVIAFKNVLEIGFQTFSQHTVACGQNWMIYYKHFPENSCWDTSSAVSYDFQECSLSGDVIKNLPSPSHKSSYRSSFLNLIFQSINQIWVKYLNIKVWMELYKCLWSTKKTKRSCQAFLQRVSAQLRYTGPQLPKARWEKPVALPVVWRKSYMYFKNSERLAPGLMFQSIYKENIYLFTDVQFKCTQQRRFTVLFSDHLPSVPRWFMYSFEHSCSCERGERNRFICWFGKGHRNAAYHSLGHCSIH